MWLWDDSRPATRQRGPQHRAPAPSALRLPVAGSLLTQDNVDAAFEEVMSATGAVHIRGSDAARVQADALFAAYQEFVNITMTTPAGPATPQLQTALQAITNARDDFLNLARAEEHSWRLPRQNCPPRQCLAGIYFGSASGPQTPIGL